MRNTIFILFLLIAGFTSVFAQFPGRREQLPLKFDNLADSPPMGWSSWNQFGCNITEDIIRDVADAIVESGLRDAGYVYVNIDDCWHGSRDSLGFIQADTVKFPSGIKALADYIHSKGLKIGIYSDAGRKTCGGRPGSFGHEYQDALQYAKWGIDYLKYDWCESQDINAKGAYNLMSAALRSAGRPILFSICEWGQNKPWTWAANTGHLWRTTGDIANIFDGVDRHPGWVSWGVMQILDMQEGLRKYAGKGHWNDPDMLEVGNGMKVNQDRAHFTMWAMLAAPLILGNDIRNMSAETKDIIMNREVIAINQDGLGVQGLRYDVKDSLQFWFKPLTDGDWAFCILNRSKNDMEYSLDWNNFNLTDSVSGLSTDFNSKTYSIRNLWTKKADGTTAKSRKVIIPAQDVLLYRLGNNEQKTFPPVNPNATPEAKALLAKLYKNVSEGKIISALHHNQLTPDDRFRADLNRIKEASGKTPLMFGGDMGWDLQQVIDLSIAEYKKGRMVTLMWHSQRPLDTGRTDFRLQCQGKLSDEEWTQLVTPGTEAHNGWLAKIDEVAGYLKQLKDRKIPVLWRPYHEMNGEWFWWGNRRGDNGFVKLWKMMYDRYVNHHHLDNLIWVWNANGPRNIPGDTAFDYDLFYPGNEYVDVLATDIYNNDWKQSHHDQLRLLGKGKLVALGEIGQVPSPATLLIQNKYAWFMIWTGFTHPRINSTSSLHDLFTMPNVLTYKK
jgi:alpha-galactosidase